MSTRTALKIRSDVCDLAELITEFTSGEDRRRRLVLAEDWPRRWSTAWQFNGSQVVWPVRDPGSVPAKLLSGHPGGTRGISHELLHGQLTARKRTRMGPVPDRRVPGVPAVSLL
ncbi:hypothetical protein ACFVZ3_30310 [Kitasatospora purpeofusca]|uniref:hypothetical protein n=1 Tax=Kitasatospora purpeofusca TaxID=67352 RepID=UPI0036C9797A